MKKIKKELLFWCGKPESLIGNEFVCYGCPDKHKCIDYNPNYPNDLIKKNGNRVIKVEKL